MTYGSNSQAHLPTRNRELPAFYYHTHFVEMLDFVDRHYAHVLGIQERQFRQAFEELSFAAQCLYVRLVNRRGQLFTTASLHYADIGNVSAALQELREHGFVMSPNAIHTDDVLQLLTRPQLVSALKVCGIRVKSSLKKAEVVTLAREHINFDLLSKTLLGSSVILQGYFGTIRFLLFLYFGQLHEGLAKFTMRDLGLVRTQDEDGDYEPRFSDREEAEQAFYFASCLDTLTKHDSAAETLYSEVSDWPTPMATKAADLRDSLALALGKKLEHKPSAALDVYRRGESVQCTERIVRLLLANHRKEDAKQYLEQCLAAPASDEEALFASDIYARKFKQKRTSLLTDALRDSPVIALDDAYRGAPEKAAVAFFERQGKRAFRAENRFWRTLFGLVFWDLIFESESSALGSPFERLPATLTERRFWDTHRSDIAHRLTLLNDRAAIQRLVLKTSSRYFGKPNGLFRWRQPILNAIITFLAVAPPDATANVLGLFCQDYLSAKHGYPDLLVIDGPDIRFIEVKAEGDQLRRNQLLRLKQLEEAGFKASIIRVQWVLDTAQAYVVVDVETTGGKGPAHRITEVGAVKVIDGMVVDTFHTLINPERAIPLGITRLTGINNAMVADAPIFADIADAFTAFSNDAIFVAHNVDFDYGFIAAEFERLGRQFRRPKLCTCASMRKLFPGKKSYALASLCSEYEIPLNTHHRALCDAQAAAQLLLIVNDRRRELLDQS